MATVYLEAPTMKELYNEINNFTDQQIKRKDGPFTVSWINIQKEDDQYVCIVSSTKLCVVVDGAVDTYVQNDLNVFVKNTKIDVDINADGVVPYVRAT